MKIKLSKTKWEEMGKKAGWLGPEPRECNCGSGQIAEAEYDARGIFLTHACPKCKRQKLSKYRQDVLDNPNYEANEPIEPEASAKNAKRVLKMAFEEKMMPGQTPYTKEEKSIKDSLIGDAARAEENVGIDELDNGPTLKQKMMDFLKSRYGGGSAKDSAEIAIYWFANHYHGGQWSELYSILSTSPYRPGPMGNLEKEDEEIQMMYEDLESVKEFRK